MNSGSARKPIGRVAVLLLGVVLVAIPPRGVCSVEGFGDVNNDGLVDISDVILLFSWLFSSGDISSVCPNLIDVNLDGKVDFSDGIYLLQYMFLSGDVPIPVHPGGDPGCYGYMDNFEVRNETATVLSPTSVMLAWETPHRSSTQVRFGPDADLSGEVTVEELVYYHQALLTNLQPETTYWYRSTSRFAGWVASGTDLRSFKTLPDASYQVRPDHPRIFLNAESLPEVRLHVADGGAREKAWNLLLDWCHAKLPTPVEDLASSDNYLDYVRAFAFAGLVGEDGDCRTKAVDLAVYLQHVDGGDNLRDTTEALAFVYDWLHDGLSETLEKELAGSIYERCLDLDAGCKDSEFVTGTSHGNTKSLALGLLALHGDDPRVDGLLARVVHDYRHGFLATWRRFAGRDGGSSKGWWYSTYTLPFELEFFAAWRSATGDDWFPVERVWCEGVLDWFLFGLRGDASFIRQGDSWIRLGMESEDRLYGTLIAKEYGSPQGQWFADRASEVAPVWGPKGVFDILWHDPSVKAIPPLGSTSRLFRNVGVVVLRESWERDSAVASFRSAEVYTLGHTHRDNCSFTLYYKGDLAMDSGIYDEFGSEHHENYYTRTVAHNTLTIFNPDEVFTKYDNVHVNDGGQRWLDAGTDVPHPWPETAEDTVDRSNGYRLGGILKYEDDPLYTYALGDGGPSYSRAKLEKFHRHFLWLKAVSGWDHPVAVVFDDVVSTRDPFRKAYLLHTQEEPLLEGRRLTARNGSGVLYQWTLVPAMPKITFIGGSGKEYWVNGRNYPPVRPPREREEPGSWRVEISPSVSQSSDRFLHVLYPGDADGPLPEEPSSFETETFQGALVGEWTILFGFVRTATEVEYPSFLEHSRHLVCGVLPLRDYDIYVDDELRETVTASVTGLIRFELESPGYVRIVSNS